MRKQKIQFGKKKVKTLNIAFRLVLWAVHDHRFLFTLENK